MNFYSQTVSTALPNGMRIYVLPRPGANIHVSCVIATGSIHEEELLGSGLSHFLEHMLFQGCRDYPGHAAADAVDRLGGSLNAYTTFNHTAVTVQCAAADAAEVIRIISRMVRDPELPESAFLTERDVILRECDLGDDDPGRSLMTKVLQHCFTVSPMRVPVIGFRTALGALTVGEMRRYHAKRYQPHRIFWVVTGGADPAAIAGAISDCCADWTSGPRAEPVILPEPRHEYGVRRESVFADPVARLAVNSVVPGVLDQRIPALEVLSGILGQGESSRLVQILENESELALHFDCSVWAQGQGGLLALTAEAQPARLDRCLARLMQELERVRREGVKSAELLREKRQLETQTLLGMRSLAVVNAAIVSTVLAGGEPDLADRYCERLKALTRDEINAAAREFLAPERLTTVLQRPEAVKRVRAAAEREVRLTPELLPATPRRVETVVIHDGSLPLVDFSIVLPGGAIFEKAEETGLSGLLADMLTAGAGKRDERQLAAALDACGAELKISARRNTLIVEGSVTHECRHRLWDLLGDILGSPRFETTAFERVKRQQSATLKSRMLDPKHVSRQTACRHLYGRHPYSWSFGFDPAIIERRSLAEVRRFYEDLWRFDQVKIGFAGKIGVEEAASLTEELCQRVVWLDGCRTLPEPPRFPAEADRIDVSLPREQCMVELFLPGPAMTDEAFLADVPLLLQIENGLSAPLFQRIREERHLAYATGVRFFGGFHPGLISFYAVTSPERADEAAEQLREEVKTLPEQPLPEELFAAARKGAARSAGQQLEQCDSVLAGAVLDLFYGRPVSQAWSLPELLAARPYQTWRQQLASYLNCKAPLLVCAGGQSR